MKRAAPTLLLLALAALGSAQEEPFGSAPDPFAAPPATEAAPDPFGSAPDPFGAAPVDSRAPVAPVDSHAPAFDPDAVNLASEPPGFELHGRANLTGALGRGDDHVDLLDDSSLELSSADLYAHWFPRAWIGALAELELDTEVQDDDRRLEVDVDLLALELRPLGDERLRLRLGWFPVPFGLERRYYSPPRNELATRPAAFVRLYPGDYSDLGAMLWWRQPITPWGSALELEVGLVRGLEEPLDRPATFQGDDNREPMVAGRVAWTVLDLDPERKGDHPLARRLPAPLRITVGGSGLFGHWDDDARRRITFAGADAEVELGGLRARVEAVFARAEGQGSAGGDRRGVGLYTLLAYHLHPDLFLVEELYLAFRYELLDPDRETRSELDLDRYHWGLGWSPVDHLLCKVGWELTRPRGGLSSRSVVYLEVGVSF